VEQGQRRHTGYCRKNLTNRTDADCERGLPPDRTLPVVSGPRWRVTRSSDFFAAFRARTATNHRQLQTHRTIDRLTTTGTN